MTIILERMEHWLMYMVEACTIVLEMFGVIILIYTAVRCFIQWIRHAAGLRLELAQGIALSLELSLIHI